MFKNKNKIISEINIVPYVDVMFVLLMIFMISAPLMIIEQSVELPKLGSSESSSLDDKVLYVDKGLKFHHNEEIVELDYINKEFKKDQVLRVGFDKNIEFGQVSEIMSTLYELGFSNVSIIFILKDS